MTSFDSNQIAQLEKHYRISLVNSFPGYKPLNLLGTVSEHGIANLCPVSSVFHLGASPPLLGLVMRPERIHNDTLRNIRQTGQYTLNNVLPAFFAMAHQTSASYASGVSEFDECGFTEQVHLDFKAPFVKESTVRAGLKLVELIEMAINGTTIVIGEIVYLLADDGLIDTDGRMDHVKAGSLTISGLDSYYAPQLLGRMAYAKPGRAPEMFAGANNKEG